MFVKSYWLSLNVPNNGYIFVSLHDALLLNEKRHTRRKTQTIKLRSCHLHIILVREDLVDKSRLNSHLDPFMTSQFCFNLEGN